MATGRTLSKWTRIYGNGYDLSGYTRSVGVLPWEFAAPDLVTINDDIHNHLLGQATIGPLSFNTILDSTAVSGSHTLLKANTAAWDLMVAIGIRAIPAVGDPVYMGKFPQKKYQAEEDGGVITASIDFDVWDAADLTVYKCPWGTLVHAKGAETGANAAAGYDDLGAAGPTAYGGYMMYQIFSLDAGTATVSLDHCTDNVPGSFIALPGATSGAIAVASTPCAGIAECARTESTRRYIRWQLALAGGATTCTFAIAYMRGTAGLYY